MLDGAGVGALPDAHLYGDEGSNTLEHIITRCQDIHLPTLVSLGLGEIVESLRTQRNIKGAYGKMAQVSKGKDTISGHWEIAGLPLIETFPVYPYGFPGDVVHCFENIIGCKILGNTVASGTEIINKLGEEHLKTGRPILYTSADSVFQLAAHEDVVPLSVLYDWCLKARNDVLQGEHAVGRVIARPFTGTSGNFWRTDNRKDFSLPPPAPTLLDVVKHFGKDVLAIGKVYDVFSGRGITQHFQASGNREIMDRLMSCIQEESSGLIWATLIDFDMVYGHRNDVEGFARALERVDFFLGDFLTKLKREDLLFITADHGCDPTFVGTDHTREYVPLLVYGQEVVANALGLRDSFADLGQTASEVLGCFPSPLKGQSFSNNLFL